MKISESGLIGQSVLRTEVLDGRIGKRYARDLLLLRTIACDGRISLFL